MTTSGTSAFNLDLIEIVEEALKKTVKIANPNIAYVDKILSTWYENEFKNIDDLEKENVKENGL